MSVTVEVKWEMRVQDGHRGAGGIDRPASEPSSGSHLTSPLVAWSAGRRQCGLRPLDEATRFGRPGKTSGGMTIYRSLLKALVEPIDRLRECEAAADYTGRLALQEEIKGLPWGAVWDHYCAAAGVVAGSQWLDDVREYERGVLAARA